MIIFQISAICFCCGHFLQHSKNMLVFRGLIISRARRAPKRFRKKFEFIKKINICKIRIAGETLFRPEKGLSHEISRFLVDMTRKNHIKIFFKVGTKSSILLQSDRNFDPPKNEKPSVQKVSLYEIYGDI